MGRIIGLIGCTCLVIAVLRLTNLEHINHTLRGGVEKASSPAKEKSARERFRWGKEQYLKGKYSNAVTALEGVTGEKSGLTAAERRQAQDYLARSTAKLNGLPSRDQAIRAQSADEEFAPPLKSQAIPHPNAAKARVDRMMTQAQAALKKGDAAEARKLAIKAVQISKDGQLEFGRKELTPAQLLARIDAAGAAEKKSAKAADLAELEEQDGGIQLTSGEEVAEEPKTLDHAWNNEGSADADNAEEADETPAGTPEQIARKLVASARDDLKAGRFDEARKKALQADELDVAWSLFEDQPMLILDAVDSRSSTTTIAKNSVKRKTEAEVVSQGSRDAAIELLKQARADLEAGKLESAREKAVAVQDMNVSYKTFDDRPELVLQDVEASQAESSPTGQLAAHETDEPAEQPASQGMQQRKQQVQSLLAQARKALADNKFDEAREYAIQADKLQVPYSVFDDRPDTVLADIARTEQRESAETGAFPSESSGAKAERSEGASIAAKKLAQELVKQAREDLADQQFDDAAAKVRKAKHLGVSEETLPESPDRLLTEIEATHKSAALAQRSKKSDPAVFGATSRGGKGRAKHAELEEEDTEEFSPIGSSAVDLYNRGMTELNRGNRDKAYAAFLAAHRSGQKLNRVQSQRMQDYLRELAPKNQGVKQVGHQFTEDEPELSPETETEAPALAQPDSLDSITGQLTAQQERLSSDVLNAVFKAERLREKNPEKGVQVIDQTIAKVEGSDLSPAAKAKLLRTLQNTRTSLETTVEQQRPNIDQARKNEEVLAKVKSEMETEIRIEQEFAKLVEEYNELYKQRRFAEAEVVAKKAFELNPREPAAVTMKIKAQLARRVDDNTQLKEKKEQSYFDQLNDVEKAAIVPVGDDNPVAFGDDWKELTERRQGKYRADNSTRSEQEIQIEKNLNKRISVNTDQMPLSEVLQQISALADINIYIDEHGLEDEQVMTNTPTTIHVESISTKSVLNLILEQNNLAYVIKDDVLKITSRMRQQGDMLTRTYPVADLVVPIPSQATGFMPGMSGIPGNGMLPGTAGVGGAQFSVPPSGLNQGFPQVGGMGDAGALGLGSSNSPRVQQATRNFDFDSLTDLLISTIAPESWEAVGGQASIRNSEMTLSLVIRQTQKTHEEIADLLGQLRRLQDLQVTIEVRFVTVSDRFFERIGLDFDFNVPSTLGRAEVDNNGNPIPRFGSVLQPQQGQSFGTTGTTGTTGTSGGTSGTTGGTTGTTGSTTGTTGTGTGRFLTPDPERQLTPTGFSMPTVVGMQQPNTFSQNYDVPFQQGSFEVGVPTFGGFNPAAGVQVGFAILSDIEAFFFIQAAQADQRNNLMFAPKVTLFNGQTASVSSFSSRPFVISVVPTVGIFATGFQPVIAFIPDGIFLTVTAVISADRRYVRLTVFPQFTNITDVFTFSFLGSSTGGQTGQANTGGQGGQGLGGGGQGGFGGGGIGGGGPGFGIGGGGFGGGGQGGGIGGGIGGQGGQTGTTGQSGTNVDVGQVTIQQPITEVVNVNTTVSVPDGGTVLLGGVKRLREGRSMAGVPILNKIPYISRLFKNTGVGRETESLMLMVTPRIIIQEEEEELLGIPTK